MSEQPDARPLSLVGDNYHAESIEELSDQRLSRIRAAQMFEHDVSALLGALDGAAERAVLEVLMAHSSIPDVGLDQIVRLVSAVKLHWIYGTGRLRHGSMTPDLFVVVADRKKLTALRVVAAIEMKIGAAVNGGAGYCRSEAHPDYSNQISCYLHGCWLRPDEGVDEISHLRPKDYIWLAPERKLTDHRFPAGGQIPGSERQRTNWGTTQESELRQKNDARRWRRVSLESVVAALDEHDPSLAAVLRANT